jgi:hypothetical protein
MVILPMNARRIFALFVLIFATIACQVSSSISGGTVEPGGVLFQDDFSNPNSGWDKVTKDDGLTNYVDGAYRIFVNQANMDIWANPGLKFDDVRIEVDAVKMAGPDDNDFGVTCRSQDENHFYFFIVSSDGYYGIGKISGDQQSLIGMDAMQPSETIKQGAASNHIRADCVGDSLSLYVNGEKLASANDSEYSNGDVGLIAGAFDTTGTDIHFDNFSVLKP